MLKLPRFKPSDNYLVSMEWVVVRASHHGLDIAVLGDTVHCTKCVCSGGYIIHRWRSRSWEVRYACESMCLWL